MKKGKSPCKYCFGMSFANIPEDYKHTKDELNTKLKNINDSDHFMLFLWIERLIIFLLNYTMLYYWPIFYIEKIDSTTNQELKIRQYCLNRIWSDIYFIFKTLFPIGLLIFSCTHFSLVIISSYFIYETILYISSIVIFPETSHSKNNRPVVFLLFSFLGTNAYYAYVYFATKSI